VVARFRRYLHGNFVTVVDGENAFASYVKYAMTLASIFFLAFATGCIKRYAAAFTSCVNPLF